MRNIYEMKNRRMFLFITGACMRSCKYCFMKDNSYKGNMNDEIRQVALGLAQRNNYHAVTLIGGEPLLCSNLLTCIDDINTHGLSCSISTAGTKNQDFLKEVLLRPLDDITVSIDSADEVINDILRGEGAFRTAVETIETALNAEVKVRVTTTINQLNKNGIPRLISFLQDLGVFQIDFHLMSYNGGAKNYRNLGLLPKEWMLLRSNIVSMHFSNIALSIPYIWLDCNNPLSNQYHNYCEMCNCDRLSVMPNGDFYTCTLAIGEEPPHGNIVNGIPAVIQPNGLFKERHLCRCEKQIGTETSDQYTYICRFVKQKIVV